MKKYKETDSDILYAVSNKEDTAYLCLHFTKDREGTKTNTPYPEEIYTPYSRYSNKIFWKISNVIPTLRNPQHAVSKTFDTPKLLKTLSLGESRSPKFNLFSDLEEYFEEEVAETMTETMEQYMSKTRADYGSRISRPKIDDKDHFELKGQFLKELRENTFSGLDHEDANEHIEKVLEIVDLFHILNITQDQVMLRAFPMSLTGVMSHWLRNKPSGSITTWEDLKTKFLSKYCPPTRTAKKMEVINNFQQEPDETLYQAWERFKKLLMRCPQHYLTEMHETAADAKVAIQKMVEYSQKWHNGTSRTRRPHYIKDCPLKEEGKTLEEAYYTQFSGPFQRGDIEQQLWDSTKETMQTSIRTRQIIEETLSKTYSEASHIDNSIPRKEKDPGSFTLPCFINNVCFDNALADLGASVSVMPLSTYLNLRLGELAHTKLSVELADRTVKYPKGIAKNVLVGIGKFVFPVDFIILDMPEDIKVPLILGKLFLSTAYAKIYVFKRNITFRVGEERIIFKSVKPASSLIKRVYMLSLRERMELDLEARLMGETLVLNRSLDPLNEDYIELNDPNEPLELRRDQGDDLIPTIKEGEVIEEFRTRDDELDTRIDDYPNYYQYDKKICIDCAHNLKFSCMIGFEFIHVNFFPLLYVNVMSKKFHNSIMKDKLVYKGNNVVGSLMSVPIFVGTVSVVTDFAVLEDMDGYHDEGMGDVIFGESFLREVGIKARRFNGMITIYNGNESVTYQMLGSHSRFKHHINEQCNKIPPLLKVSEKDKMNGISHPYQKLNGFYKGVLNLGPDYIRDAKMEEWLTREHISMHEMEW
ncbi:putative reverse transcriptase domain-containing protein [Tanacetum coccineum]